MPRSNEHDAQKPNVCSPLKSGGSCKEREANTDSGWAWVVCFGAFFVLFFAFGQHNCAGIIFSGILDEFHGGRGETAWVTSLASGVKHAFGPVAVFLADRYGCRVVAILGGATCAVGLLISSFSTSLYLLYVTYGVVWGLGTCLSYCSTFIIVSLYFKRRLALACGIVTVGAAVGGLVLGPVIQLLLKAVGFRSTLRVLAGLQVTVVLAGLLYRPKMCTQDTSPKPRTLYDFSMLRNKAYVIWVLSLVVFMPSYLVPFGHLVRFSEDNGITKLHAAFLVTFTAAGTIVGRIFFGGISDLNLFKRYYIMPLGQLGLAVTLTFIPVSGSYPWIATCSCLFGFFEGCFVTLLPVLTSDIVGRDKFSSGFGSLLFILSIPETAGSPIAGWIHDTWKSYTIVFIACGGLTVISTCIMQMVPLYLATEYPQIEKQDSLLPSSRDLEKRKCSGLVDNSIVVVRETVL